MKIYNIYAEVTYLSYTKQINFKIMADYDMLYSFIVMCVKNRIENKSYNAIEIQIDKEESKTINL